MEHTQEYYDKYWEDLMLHQIETGEDTNEEIYQLMMEELTKELMEVLLESNLINLIDDNGLEKVKTKRDDRLYRLITKTTASIMISNSKEHYENSHILHETLQALYLYVTINYHQKTDIEAGKAHFKNIIDSTIQLISKTEEFNK